jgi:hypothetical protein
VIYAVVLILIALLRPRGLASLIVSWRKTPTQAKERR